MSEQTVTETTEPEVKKPGVAHAICAVCYPDLDAPRISVCGLPSTAKYRPPDFKAGSIRCAVCLDLWPAHERSHRD